MKRSREIRLQDALEELIKAINMKEIPPHIQIDMQWGIDLDSEHGQKFRKEIRNFINAYKDYYKVEEVNVKLLVNGLPQ